MFKKYLKVFSWVLWAIYFIPVVVFGDSISFVPASPEVYDGTSDVTVTCSASGSNWWTMFAVDGNVTNPGGGAWQTGSGCGGTVNAYLGGTFQAKAGSAGIVHWLNWTNDGGGTLSACFLAGATYSACKASSGYLGQDEEYELCSGSCPPPPSPPPPPPQITLSTTTPNGGGTLFTTMLEWWGLGAVQLALIFIPVVAGVAMIKRKARVL